MNFQRSNKEPLDDEIICYCSDLKKSEIYRAVNNGCTSIIEVRNYTNKTITGNCEQMNPKGICCHKEFKLVINQALKHKF